MPSTPLKKFEIASAVVVVIVASMAFYAGMLTQQRQANAFDLTTRAVPNPTVPPIDPNDGNSDANAWLKACLELGGVTIVGHDFRIIPGGPLDNSAHVNSAGQSFQDVINSCFKEYNLRLKHNTTL